MIESYILIHTEAGRAGQVVRAVRELSEIDHAECVTGAYDVIARASVPNPARLARLVEQRIHSIRGVLRTLTCPAIGHERLWEEHLEPASAGG